MNSKKKAALTGVMYYLQEEHIRLEQEQLRAIPCQRYNPWASFSRKAISRQRSLVQGKAFKKHGSHICTLVPVVDLSRHHTIPHTCNQCRNVVTNGDYQVRMRIGSK